MSEGLTLAITNIGDLLLNGAITRGSEGVKIPDIHLNIPEYQRPYKWVAANAVQLLNDILEAMAANKETYRIGTLILHKNTNTKDGITTYDIVDGQQRTITLSLLLIALGVDKIPFLDQSLTDNEFSRRNIANNYRALQRRVQAGDTDTPEGSTQTIRKEYEKLAEYIQNNCELIVVITQDVSEAFQFFDSQNARGKPLYPHDLLKAYHLREMTDLEVSETERIVKSWEDMKQETLSGLFSDYLYRVKEWTKGNRATQLDTHNLSMFKGVARQDNYPYAQFYKGAFAYADTVNASTVPFVTGIHHLAPFQLDTPIVAGKPFFEYAKHYYEILADIKNNDKYEGYFINDNAIIKTLDLPKYRNGTGNGIARLLLDTAILLYVDRFCPEKPAKEDLEMLDQFVVYAFVWAYSLRAQYTNLGWQTAQNYILGSGYNGKTNSFNIYRTITDADSPVTLLSRLADLVNPLGNNVKAKTDGVNSMENGVYTNYLHYFKANKFWEEG